jgi:hypothetical protein
MLGPQCYEECLCTLRAPLWGCKLVRCCRLTGTVCSLPSVGRALYFSLSRGRWTPGWLILRSIHGGTRLSMRLPTNSGCLCWLNTHKLLPPPFTHAHTTHTHRTHTTNEDITGGQMKSRRQFFHFSVFGIHLKWSFKFCQEWTELQSH